MYVCTLFGALFDTPGGIDVSQISYACFMIVCMYRRAREYWEYYICAANDTSYIVLHIVYKKRLVWADNMFCVPEQLVDSDVVALERACIAW